MQSKNNPLYFDAKWNLVIKHLPNGGAYSFHKRQAGFDIIKSRIPEQSIVFDYACGLGLIDIQLEREKNCNCSGCDFSPVAIKYLQEHSRNPENWRVSDKFFGYSYDYVIGVQILEHLKNPVDWMKTALKVGSKVIVALPNNFTRTGEHVNMAWQSWDEFRRLFSGFKFERIDSYNKTVETAYKHPIWEFIR